MLSVLSSCPRKPPGAAADPKEAFAKSLNDWWTATAKEFEKKDQGAKVYPPLPALVRQVLVKEVLHKAPSEPNKTKAQAICVCNKLWCVHKDAADLWPHLEFKVDHHSLWDIRHHTIYQDRRIMYQMNFWKTNEDGSKSDCWFFIPKEAHELLLTCLFEGENAVQVRAFLKPLVSTELKEEEESFAPNEQFPEQRVPAAGLPSKHAALDRQRRR